ncbi:MAG TPA: DUF4337 domain-containing protein [Acetobacteraceae bacterium]|nr:DUF4337 domain-containing protein [Acetobacteraceae bacterium]
MAGHGHGHGDHGGNKSIALLIAVLALFLALAETGAKSAQTEALARNIEAANLWAFFQARTIRQTTVRTAAEEAALGLVGLEDATRRAAIERQIAGWRATADRWESEPQTGEGRRELMNRAREAERRRERSMSAYHMYEYGSAAFQVAIVLASASIVTGVPLLAVIGGVLGVIGMGLSGLGFFAPELIHL